MPFIFVQELNFRQDDEARNKQIQASIAQVSQRQSKALVKRKSVGKGTAILSRSRRSGGGSRRRRNCRNIEQDTSEANDDDDQNKRGKDSSSDEPCERQRKKRSATQPSSSNANNNDNCAGNGTEQTHQRDSRVISPVLVWNSELIAWGRGGTRSNTRQGNNNQGAISKRNARLKRLVEYLGSLEGNSVEVTKENDLC
jgi:E3 ubiquitin-protein ligase RNF1/2